MSAPDGPSPGSGPWGALSLVLLGAALGAVLFAYLGWLGLGLLGLSGLLITTRLELYGDNAAAQFPSVMGVKHQVRRIEAQRRLSPEEKQAAAARRSERSRAIYLVNTVCLSLIMLGFSMFFIRQM